MSKKITNGAIIKFLKSKYKSTGFIDGLKIRYRSLICPFISLIEMVKPGDAVADVGCGSGQFMLLVSEFADPQSVYGIEISERLVSNAKTLFSTLPRGLYNFEQYDGQTFPARLAEVDIIYLVDVLHHVPFIEQKKFMNRLIAAMKPGAKLVLKDINANSLFVYFNKMHDFIFAGEIGNEIKMKAAIELLEENGLTIVKQEKRRMYVYPHYTIVAKK
ncbi:MAG TPA: class I SAM-dependent methyltransferase [Ferruginibacter sp.]|nr:class I SAM-dependent methyltransferase [Ferruginibacter sp.]HRE63030.1 class I SAM-dependent methyltransferase [Ferruginibacter sp.]